MFPNEIREYKNPNKETFYEFEYLPNREDLWLFGLPTSNRIPPNFLDNKLSGTPLRAHFDDKCIYVPDSKRKSLHRVYRGVDKNTCFLIRSDITRICLTGKDEPRRVLLPSTNMSKYCSRKTLKRR